MIKVLVKKRLNWMKDVLHILLPIKLLMYLIRLFKEKIKMLDNFFVKMMLKLKVMNLIIWVIEKE